MRALYLASVFLHVMAALTWVGGMVAFVVAVMPYFRGRAASERAAFLAWFGPRFRSITWICFGVLIATGTFNLWSLGVTLSDFARPEWRDTSFGHLVIVKLSLVAAAALLSVAHDRTALRTGARWMGRSLLVLGAMVIAAAVMLVRAI